MKILVDGGIRSGVDIFKALALGADGVLIGKMCIRDRLLLLAAVIRVVVGGERLVLELRPSALECLVKDKEAITVRGRLSRIEEKSNGQMLTLIDNSIKSKKASFQEKAILIYLDSKNSEEMCIRDRSWRGGISL